MLKVCTRCLEEKPTLLFHRDKRTKEGLRSMCKVCTNKDSSSREDRYKVTRKRYREAHKGAKSTCNQKRYDLNKQKILETNRLWRQSVTGRFASYKRGAKTRGISFTLSREDFLTFYNNCCNYCGDKIEGVGIDRVDNKVGYQLDNCVPCCTVCNKMKTNLSLGSFIEHITKIYGRFYDN